MAISKMTLAVAVGLLAVSASFMVADAMQVQKDGPLSFVERLFWTHPNDSNIIDTINNAKLTWKAGKNNVWDSYKPEDLAGLMGTKLDTEDTKVPKASTLMAKSTVSIPDSFDSREAFSGFIHPIRNQMRCGSCWAFAAAESLSDRFTIASKGKIDVVLSPEDLVSCDVTDNGCMGGMIPNAWNYLADTGIVSDKCFPYTAGGGAAPVCETKCVDGEAFKKYKASNPVHLDTVEAIQQAIMTEGPVEAGFMVHKSFMSYKSGVYQHQWWKVWDSVLGGHAVKIVGWGTENGVDYWLVANSWSTEWGEEGYFKIRRGHNDCGFEASVFAGTPVLE